VFFLLVLALTAALAVGLNVYVYRAVVRAFAPGPRVRRALVVVLATALSAAALARAIRLAGLWDALRALAAVEAFVWTLEIGVILTAALLVPIDLVRLGGHLGARLPRRGGRATERIAARSAVEDRSGAPTERPLAPEDEPPRSPAPVLARRAFLTESATVAAAAIGGGVSLYGTLFGRHEYAVEEAVFALPRLAPAYDGYTIVQLSDIHFGRFVGPWELEAAVRLVRAARPDLIVLTGDLVDHDLAYLPYLGRLVRRLQGVARDGVTAIAGNHDHYAGVEEVLAAVEAGGGQVLRNAGRVIGSPRAGFNLLGVDDVWAGTRFPGAGPDLARALGDTAPALPRVLLCHNPSFFPESSSAVDLQLSGHTHGGQVQLGLNPAELVLPYGYVAGRYALGAAQLYVNRGFGTAGPPTRVLSPPEVTRVVLTSA